MTAKSKTSLIIVDDNTEFRNLLTKFLLADGQYDVIGLAENGESGYKLIDDLRPQVIILDLLMPDITGIDVFTSVRVIPGYRPEVFMYSAMQSDEIIQTVLALGIRGFFIKPFEMDIFVYRLNSYLGKDTSEFKIDLPKKTPLHKKYMIKATNILRKLGIPPHINGYKFLREAIVIAVEDFNKINTVMTNIYKPIAFMNNSTTNNVERAMRHAITSAWNRSRVYVLEELFGNTVDVNKDKPSNREFIARVADKIIIDML